MQVKLWVKMMLLTELDIRVLQHLDFGVVQNSRPVLDCMVSIASGTSILTAEGAARAGLSRDTTSTSESSDSPVSEYSPDSPSDVSRIKHKASSVLSFLPLISK